MGQYWNLFAVDAGHRYEVEKLNEHWWNAHLHRSQDLFYLFAKRSQHGMNHPVLPPRTPIRMAISEGPPTLLSLPPELLGQILDNLNPRSCIRASLVSERLWELGMYSLERKIQNWLWSWRGSRIVCFGDCCEQDEILEGVLTTEEGAALCTSIYDECDPDDGESDLDPDQWCDYEPCPDNDELDMVSEVVGPRFRQIEAQCPHLYLPRVIDWTECDHLPLSKRKYLWELLHRTPSDYFPSNEVWVLRNLTAKEFVRGDGLYTAFQGPVCPHGPDIGYPGFFHAILSRVCLTTSAWSTPKGCLLRGPWYGHRFEICSQSDHILGSDAHWNDVTAKVVAELASMFEAFP